jgi:hypothetical protein
MRSNELAATAIVESGALVLDVFAALSVQPVIPNMLATLFCARVWAKDAQFHAESIADYGPSNK